MRNARSKPADLDDEVERGTVANLDAMVDVTLALVDAALTSDTIA